MSEWIKYCKQVHAEMKKKNPDATFREALIQASKNKKNGTMKLGKTTTSLSGKKKSKKKSTKKKKKQSKRKSSKKSKKKK